MKYWINRNYKTLIITAFLIPIITVAIVSISHVTQWYGISNPLTWAIYLSVGIEIAAMSALAAISANMGRNVYFPFIIVTLIQFIGNIFFAYEYIDVTNKMFTSWVELVSPLVGFMGVEPTDLIAHKRFLALFAGGFLPVISLSFLHMLVKFTEEDRMKDVKEDEEIHQKEIEEKIKHETTIKAEDIEGLKDLVEDAMRVKLSQDELSTIENVLQNYDNHKITFTDEAVKKLDDLIEEKSKELDIVNPDDMMDDDDLYNQKENENDEDLEQDLDEEVSNIIPEPIVFKSPGVPFKMIDNDLLPKETSIKTYRPSGPPVVILRQNDSQGVEPSFDKLYTRRNEVSEPQTVSLQDHGHCNGLTPLKKELEPEVNESEISTFDDDLMEDYIPMKYEDDYYIHYDEPEEEPEEDDEDEPVVGDHYPLEQESEESEEPRDLTTREKIEEILDRKTEESDDDKKKS